ncbi:CalY family protein [Haloarchaeobius sp. HME9146]|uniref:CalY family protein n=1 Tax=Haloarchaeobius sp. HME9146 TaxID=2978732 RepID=UPI0021BF0326|nr:CalY family protein [Haloarchaeobius sp. HME9146]MCT9097350.1 CalY family protein [Haloarchaeobius sp. HME9146]
MLGALGTAGVASATAGLGTSAFFSDQETFEANRLVAGELDLMVDWQEHYSDWSEAEARAAPSARMVDGPGELEEGEYALPTYLDPMLAIDETDVEAFMDATATEAQPDEDGDGEQDLVLTRNQLRWQHSTWSDERIEREFRAQFANVPDDLTRPLIDLGDVKPGDFGEVTLSVHLFDNPGYLWLTGTLVAGFENGHSEPESDDKDERGDDPGEAEVVELLDEVQAAVWQDDGDNIYEDGETVTSPHDVDSPSTIDLTADQALLAKGSLREVLSVLSSGNGIPVDADPRTNDRTCFANSTTRYFGFAWWLPVDHANEIQTDSVTFDLGFYTEQCRHNDGRGLPPREHVTLRGDYAQAAGFEPVTDRAAAGDGSWGSLDDADRAFLYLGPDFASFNTLPSFTVDDIEEISYRTWSDTVTNPSNPNFYASIYTRAASDPNPDAWYGKRLTLDPAYATETANPDVDAPAGQWNRWTTRATSQNTLGVYDANRYGVGFGYTDGTIPTLSDLQSAAAFDWEDWRSAAASTAIDYGAQEVKTISVAVGNPWWPDFTGHLDAITVQLTSGEELQVDLEP